MDSVLYGLLACLCMAPVPADPSRAPADEKERVVSVPVKSLEPLNAQDIKDKLKKFFSDSEVTSVEKFLATFVVSDEVKLERDWDNFFALISPIPLDDRESFFKCALELLSELSSPSILVRLDILKMYLKIKPEEWHALTSFLASKEEGLFVGLEECERKQLLSSLARSENLSEWKVWHDEYLAKNPGSLEPSKKLGLFFEKKRALSPGRKMPVMGRVTQPPVAKTRTTDAGE